MKKKITLLLIFILLLTIFIIIFNYRETNVSPNVMNAPQGECDFDGGELLGYNKQTKKYICIPSNEVEKLNCDQDTHNFFYDKKYFCLPKEN